MSYVHGARCEDYLKLHRLGTFVMQALFAYMLTDRDYQLYLMMLEMVTVRLPLSLEQQLSLEQSVAVRVMEKVLASSQRGPEPVLKWLRINTPSPMRPMLLWLVQRWGPTPTARSDLREPFVYRP